ncbi:MAG: 50S ribosome-binding GTPase [Phycisphaerae bacterium]|nr:50S ribosome-binding GTPase [Phycisphaerae bacterium]
MIPTAHVTVASPLTPPGRGGIGAIHLSGPRCERILAAVFRPRVPAERCGELALGWLIDPADGEAIDQVLVARGKNEAEINLHGGPAVQTVALELLAAYGADVAAADATEGLDASHPQWDNPAIGHEMLRHLPQAGSLLAAVALSAQWAGGLSRLARHVLETGASETTATDLRAAARGVAAMRRLLAPTEVVIAGPPNAGKSALANALVGRQVSIVHNHAGTTRDWVRSPAVIDGVLIGLTDTAGLWSAPERESVDAEAVRRARGRAEQADLVLLASPGGTAHVPDWLGDDPVLRVATKADVSDVSPMADVAVSVRTGAGLDALRKAVVAALGLAAFQPTDPAAFTQRQQRLLDRAAEAIECDDPDSAHAELQELLDGPL